MRIAAIKEIKFWFLLSGFFVGFLDKAEKQSERRGGWRWPEIGEEEDREGRRRTKHKIMEHFFFFFIKAQKHQIRPNTTQLLAASDYSTKATNTKKQKISSAKQTH